ncbi:MAG: 2Fe-2S iron-sulfur cluster-binding protein [Candidatus Firestonebacteria bacterium]
MMNITIDGKEIVSDKGKTILELAKESGIKIPTLCYHPALEPYGGCRLCLVEITKEVWKGWSKLVVSCAYPAEDGLIVKTNSSEVIEARKFIIELLLARTPSAKTIQDLAKEYGIEKSKFAEIAEMKEDKDSLKNCILCGLCVRVIGANVISLAYRGVTRKVMTPYNEASDVCLNCGACAFVCPTGAIEINDIIPYRKITAWHTESELKQCSLCEKYFVPVILHNKLKEKVNINLDLNLLDLCPDCRRKKIGTTTILNLCK